MEINENESVPLENKGGGGRKPCREFEEILDKIGAEGKYQKWLLYGMLCPITVFIPFMVYNNIFLWDVPQHWCHVPGKGDGMSLEEWKNLTLPWEKGPTGEMRYSQCKMFARNSLFGGGNWVNESEVVECQSGWEYDTTDYAATISSEYDWVCERDYYATDCFFWVSIGNALGTVIFGSLADKWGRKPTFFVTILVNTLFKTGSLFIAHNYTVYKFLQIFGGMGFPICYSICNLIVTEVSGTEYRSWVFSICWMIWVLGNAMIPWVAMVCRTWFLFGMVSAAPVLIFLYYPFMTDSPRWLITAGRKKEAMETILKIAKINGNEVDEEELEEMVDELIAKQKKEMENKSLGFWSLFAKPRLAKNTILLTISWTMNGVLYTGITLNSTNMSGSTFLNYFLLALMELPGGYFGGRLVEITGRRWTKTGFFAFCTLACIVCAIGANYPSLSLMVVIGALLIKLGVSITDLVTYIQGAEIFPTQLRSTGVGLAGTVCYTIGIFAPYIVYTGTTHVSFPYILLGGCAFIGLLTSSFLPETYQQPLPESVEDANDFGKGQDFWSYLPQAQEKKRNSILSAGRGSILMRRFSLK